MGGRDDRSGGKKKEKGRRGLGICFWNIAEINNKFNEMWEYLGLAET